MPYISCSHCHATSYVSLSYLQRSEPCPACDKRLSERATAVAPALAQTAPDRSGLGPGVADGSSAGTSMTGESTRRR
jgi:ribulose-5-phosphate 4-epimerase/fuculose-1-phosphate aldolase